MAAKAREKGEDRIVFCVDTMASTPVTKVEDEIKFDFAPGNPALFMLLAGDLSNARELIGIYKRYVKELNPDDPGNRDMCELLRPPLLEYQSRRIEEYVVKNYGISYAQFRKERRELHADVCYNDEDAVELIICAFDKSKNARLFHVENMKLREQSDYACIGIGSNAAYYSLASRKQRRTMQVGLTLYHLWEAKKFGELSPTVSKSTIAGKMSGTDPNDFNLVMPPGPESLDRLYGQYGPQDVPNSLPLPGGMSNYAKSNGTTHD
jgi:hypothetical protein